MLDLIAWISLIITVIIEFLIYLVVIRKKVWNLLLYAVLINVFTVPLAYLFYGMYPSLFFFIEFVVFLVEAFLIGKLFEIKWTKAALISLVANFITMMIGIVLVFRYAL